MIIERPVLFPGKESALFGVLSEPDWTADSELAVVVLPATVPGGMRSHNGVLVRLSRVLAGAVVGCLATVGTHDMPPAAAFLTGEQVTIRAGLGQLTRPEAEERAGARADRGDVGSRPGQRYRGSDAERAGIHGPQRSLIGRDPQVRARVSDRQGDRVVGDEDAALTMSRERKAKTAA